MNREFTGREKVLMVILAVIVIALGYFKLILGPINDSVDYYKGETTLEQTMVDENATRLLQLQKMKAAVAEIKAAGTEKAIPQYDNSGRLMVELYGILGSTEEYSLDYSSGVVEDGYIILRPIKLSFKTTTYAQARGILDALSGSDNVNQISDLDIEYVENQSNFTGYETTLVITYFEVAS